MQVFSQKYVIAQFIDQVTAGYEFSSDEWPLHVTIAGVFAVDFDDSLYSNLHDLIKDTRQFTAAIGKDDYFGPNNDVHVALVEINDKLANLHSKVINFLNREGAIFNDPQYNKDGFKPHATVQRNRRLNSGEEVAFKDLAIVDMFPDQDPYRRKILDIVRFSESQ